MVDLVKVKKNGDIGLRRKPPPLVDLIHQNVYFILFIASLMDLPDFDTQPPKNYTYLEI